MSGHSKWATIHRKKGELDAARGKVFQKLAKELFVAAKSGSPDPDSNASLRMVVEKARSANMPKDKIQSAIDKAAGAGSNENYDSIRYEGYGPAGVAIMCDCLTDNKNRTASDVRAAFTHHGGNLGTSGSVSYMFERRGIIDIPSDYPEDDMMMCALDNGALDFVHDGDVYEITTLAEDFIKCKKALEEAGVKEFLTSEVTFVPTNTVEVEDPEKREKVEGLIDTLDDLDDVQAVYSNLKD